MIRAWMAAGRRFIRFGKRSHRAPVRGLLWCDRCRSMIEVDPWRDDLDDHMRGHASWYGGGL